MCCWIKFRFIVHVDIVCKIVVIQMSQLLILTFCHYKVIVLLSFPMCLLCFFPLNFISVNSSTSGQVTFFLLIKVLSL